LIYQFVFDIRTAHHPLKKKIKQRGQWRKRERKRKRGKERKRHRERKRYES
jgi:hypothetical protein